MLRGDEIRGNNTMRIPAVFILAGAIFVCAIGLAHAEPTMSIQYSTDNQGWFEYLVTNTSAQAEHNNMVEFSLPAGTNQGIYDAVAPTGWLFAINPNDIIFIGNGNYIAPGNQELFELYSTDLNIHQDYATANAVGPPQGLAFDSVLVDVPGEFPRTLDADIYFDGIVNFRDFAVLAGEWMDTEDWYVLPTGGDGPTMAVDSSYSIADYDQWADTPHPGDELLLQYEVTNTTSGSDPDNALIIFSVPCGINQGVYDAVAPDVGWDLTINNNDTTFTGDTFALSAGGNQGLFELYSTELNLSKGYATALSASNPPQSFNSAEVDIPIIRTLFADITGNGIVDTNDLKQMSGQWLMTESWYAP